MTFAHFKRNKSFFCSLLFAFTNYCQCELIFILHWFSKWSQFTSHYSKYLSSSAPSRLQKSTFANTYTQKLYTIAHVHHKNLIHTPWVQRPFISLFISIISRNYRSVLSGSVELESECLLLARSYISHSRRGEVRNGRFVNNASRRRRNKDKINPLAQTASPFFWLIPHL